MNKNPRWMPLLLTGLLAFVVGLCQAGEGDKKPVKAGTAPQQRAILICVAPDAAMPLQDAAAALVREPAAVPLLNALLQTGAATAVLAESSEELLREVTKKPRYERAAFNHLVVLGLPQSDRLLARCAGQQVALAEANKSFYREGYGHLRGDIGWVECDRNPFEYSPRIADAPVTTILVKITGTSPAGVLAALAAFRAGMLNGVVSADPAGKVLRPQATLLDRDPDATPPPAAVRALPGGLVFAGWTQPSEEEYRDFPDYGAPEPARLWRVKYLAPGALDGVTLAHWNQGVQRKAFANAVTVAAFSGAPGLGAQDAWRALEKAEWRGKPLLRKHTVRGLPALQVAQAEDMTVPQVPSPPLIYLPAGPYLLLSSLPEQALAAYLPALQRQ